MTTHACWAEIDTSALEENYRLLRSLAPASAECVAVVKANAYGHGISLCTPAALRAGARWLAVASVDEAIAVRALAPSTRADARILAIGGVLPGWGAAVIDHGITPSIWTHQHLDELESAARAAPGGVASLPVHLEIDTGMSRQGIHIEELSTLLARFTAQSPLRIEAVMTHLYASDESDRAKSTAQLAQLAQALHIIQSSPAATHLQYLSAGASAALLGADAEAVAALAAEFRLTPMFRIGLALYGVAPRFSPPTYSAPQLRPVLAWKTRVAGLRTIPTGTEVGYNGTFTATEPMRLALIPAGYADGLDRKLGNRFSLLVRGERAPLVGRVSMDMAVLDVTEIPGVETGDEVVILGTQASETISAYDLADASETIPWEIFTRIGQRVARIAV
jgi:alanine racemase